MLGDEQIRREMMKTLSSLAQDVSALRVTVSTLTGSVNKLAWVIPLIVGIGIAAIGIIVSIK